NKRTKLNTAIWLTVVALGVLSLPAAATAQDVDDFNVPDINLAEDPNLQMAPEIPGRVEGTGTYFEVTDSNYLGITFESIEPVHLTLESAPQMVVMEIEAANDVNSTQITLGGFEPNATYYKYEDNYHNEVALTTDPNGSHAYLQDLCKPHIIFIQPSRSTIFLSDSGWSDPTVGDWDPDTKTATLTQDVYETIIIDSDGITLNGNGRSVIGSGTGSGVHLYQKSNVTITDLTIEGFYYGIYLRESTNNILIGNTANSNRYGIYLLYSNNSTLIANTANSNNSYGIYLYDSGSSTLTENTTSNNFHGIYLYVSGSNTLTGNTANSNWYYGINLVGSGTSTLSGNTMSGNRWNFHVAGGTDSDFDNNIDTTNTVDGNPVYYVKNITGTEEDPVVYDQSTIAGTFYAINCDYITIRNLTLTNNGVGVCLYGTHNSTIENVSASNNYYGVYLSYSSGNIMTGNTASNNYYGIYLYSSGDSILTGNTANSNRFYAIRLYHSSGSTLTANTANSNGRHGIYLSSSGSSTLSGNTMSGNGYNFHVAGGTDSDFDNNVDTTNTVDGKPVYYVKNAGGQVYDSSTNAGVFYAINCNSITIKDLTLTRNGCGVFLWKTPNSTIENVIASNNTHGIYLDQSSGNTLTANTANTANSNSGHGIYLMQSTNSALTANTASSNSANSMPNGIYLYYSGSSTLTGNTANSNDSYGI
ncbi:MAG: right-handed parallel beta-helix repeat-containing protein, partial [Planctomycetota bacterium]